jgi:hypothetical protein
MSDRRETGYRLKRRRPLSGSLLHAEWFGESERMEYDAAHSLCNHTHYT